jgi:ATP-dependent exoDNAse (exonuclease V) beta subunit
MAPPRREDGRRPKVPPGGWRRAFLESPLPEVETVRVALSATLQDAGREGWDSTLTRAWEAVKGPRAIASLFGTAGVVNCLRYFDLVRQVPGLSGPETVLGLERLLAEAYTPPSPEAANSPVQLMTIHKAKGLEFDHVFVPALDYDPLRAGGRARAPFLMLSLPLPGRPMFAAPEGDRRTGARTLAYEILRRLDDGRQMAEVKRLLYVAATRARKGLALSGAVKLEDAPEGGPAPRAARNSPLALLLESLLEEGAPKPAFETLGLVCESPPPLQAVPPLEPPPRRPPGEAPPFNPAPLPYVVRSPSERLDHEEEQDVRPGEDEAVTGGDPGPRAAGVVVHRILETLANGSTPPRQEAVAAALREEGLGEPEALGLAPALVREARQAWEDPAFSSLREGARLLPEWPLEQAEGRDHWVGRLDLVLDGREEVHVLDYKTSRPPEGQDPEEFASAVRERYAPQLRRYARMLGAHPRFAGKRVRAFLLLTALSRNRLVEVSGS